MDLSVKLLGQFEIRDSSGEALSLPTRKTRALLGYLTINADKPQPRERLMSLLWSDRGDKQARQSLNHSLRAIRKLAEQENITLLESDGETVTLHGEALDSDVARFRQLLNDHPGEAADLYSGPFLDGLSISDHAFEEWLRETQAQFHAQACEALKAAAASDDSTKSGDIDQRIDWLHRLLTLDPLREEAHRQLMQLLHQSGDRPGALRQYQECVDILNSELEVEPDATTKALYEEIRSDEGVAMPQDLKPQQTPQATPSPQDRAEPVNTPGLQQVSNLSKIPRRWLIGVVAVLLIVTAGLAISLFTQSDTVNQGQQEEKLAQQSQKPADVDKTSDGSTATPLPKKPSIAVLPFVNMSGEEEQEYFSDGMTEDLLTDLSRISALTVISRTSSFAYKGKSPDVRDLAEELGVSHVIEGSVRKVGGRVRINAQLIDVATGTHLWAQRYDREFKDIFALQDEVRGKIVLALAIKLAPEEGQLISLKRTKSADAYDLFLKGRHKESSFTREDNAEAIQFYEEAIAIDPTYANVYARLANMYDFKVRFGWSDDAEAERLKALNLAQKAVALDENNPFAHWANGRIISRLGSKDIENQHKAIRSLEHAIKLDLNYADAYAFVSLLYLGIGEPDKALSTMKTAMKLNPQYPFWYSQNRGIIHYMLGNYQFAVTDFEKAVERNPTAVFTLWWLAAAYGQAGQIDDAEWQIEEMRGLGLQPTVSYIVNLHTSTLYHPPYIESLAAGLRKAGIPE